MHLNLKNPVVLVWLGLVLVSVMSWAIGAEHGFSLGTSQNLGMALVLVLAFVKTQLIGSFFMELRTAPRPLRIAFSGWVVGVGAFVIAMYLWA